MSNVILDLLPFTLRFKKGPQLFRTDIASSITMSVSRLKTSQGLFTRHHQFQQKTTAIGNRQGEHACIHASHHIPSDPIYFQHHFLSGGRRGNIVQVYPSVEYDFVPSELSVEQGTLLHFQWTGSDANPNGNAGGSQWGPVLKSTKTTVRFGD